MPGPHFTSLLYRYWANFALTSLDKRDFFFTKISQPVVAIFIEVTIHLSFDIDRSPRTSKQMWNIVVIFTVLQNVLCYNDFFEDNDEVYVRVDEEYQEYAVPIQCGQYCTETRQKRQYSPGRSRVIEAMLKAPTLNLSSNQPDLFYVLRDNYELPKGRYKNYK